MSYLKTPIYLSNAQLMKISKAKQENNQVNIRIDVNKKPNYDAYLTKTQNEKLMKNKKINQNFEITLSKTQLSKTGGFVVSVPLLLAGIGAAASAAGASAGIVKAVNEKKHQKNTEKEQARHNKEMEKLLKNTKSLNLGKKSNGKGVYLPKKNYQ